MQMLSIFRRFRSDRRANVAVQFALVMTPVITISGAAIDYGNAVRLGKQLQGVVDAATLTGAILTADNRDQLALNAFNAGTLAAKMGTGVSASFTVGSSAGIGAVYTGTGTVTVPTSMMRLMGINSLTVRRKATAAFGTGDAACITTLGGDMDLEDNSMVFNGSPNVTLSGCALRSNQSIKCNGNNIGATASIAAGVATNCPNPQNYASRLPDIYAPLASNITKQCGTTSGDVSWSDSMSPNGPNVIKISRIGYTEIHICGNANLSGSGNLAGTGASGDTVIIIENGDLNLANNADLHLLNTSVIFTGDTSSGVIDFPNGNGKSATITLSAGVNDDNPFRGIAAYQDPRLAANGNNNQSWTSGAKIFFDGIAYLPNSDVTLSGQVGTGSSGCSKLVVNSFRINGAVGLQQSATGCKDQKVSQYQTWPRLLN